MDEIRRQAQGDPGSAYDSILRAIASGICQPTKGSIKANKNAIFAFNSNASARHGYCDANGDSNGRWETQWSYAIDQL